ncbi:hypothetical protein BJY01DRAFT_254105 [Aspergillus pseudoustus]|uniref:Uncharacterized protein n=1 Tax=Aspergillus pseudoustus TaxID=1810923 RepID=A0ABR4IVT9_9EURO
MRWTEDNKDILWSTIFKTQSFHLDLDTISAEWTGDEKPTPKAIKEFLGRYRKSLRADNKITFGMSAKRAAEDGIPAGKPRKKAATSADTTSGVGGVQKNKAATKRRGRAAAASKGKGKDVNTNAEGKKKLQQQPQNEEDEEHESGDEETEHNDDDDEAVAIKQEVGEVPMAEDAQQGTPLPQVVIKREVNVEDEQY